MRAIIAIAMTCLVAFASSVPAYAYSCAQVRAWHRFYGSAELLRLAQARGLTPAQIAAGRRCLRRR